MQEIKVHPFIKFSLLLLQFLTIIFIEKNTILLVVALIISLTSILFKVKFKPILLALTYGIFLALFTLVFNYLFSNSLLYAISAALGVFTRFYIIITASIFYKTYTNNKEMAYVISKIASKLGFKQNKVYTVILIILNQIYNLRNLIFNLYKFNNLNQLDNSKVNQVKNTIKLLPVFINNALRQNDNFTLALINKNYNEDRAIRVYLNYNISNKLSIMIIAIYLFEILLIIIL